MSFDPTRLRRKFIAICTIIGGHIVGRVGYFQPFLLFGGTLLTIGAGLLYTLDIGSSAGQYIGYQILVGVGIGTAIQIPVTASQAFSEMVDIPLVTANVLCKVFLSIMSHHRGRC